LQEAAKDVFSNKNTGQPLADVVSMPKVTIREQIRFIIDTLKRNKNITFRSLFTRKRSRVDVVVTFLAMLELIKRKLVAATQQTLFGEISIEAIDNLDVSEEEQLEFND